jgi:hypothetical protein
MASHFGQMAMVVDRLLEKTTQGTIAWSKSATRGQFQARFDDFLVQIWGTRSAGVFGTLLAGIPQKGSIRVSTISGELIGEISYHDFNEVLGVKNPPKALLDKLQELYDIVADESEDLSRLLKAIG